MLSRRRLLIGAGATVVVSGGAWVEAGAARRHRLLHAAGLVGGSPDHHVAPSGTPLVSGTLTSSYMGRPVNWTLSMPTTPLIGIVYCLHGYGEGHRFAFDQIHLHDVVAAQGAALSVASVDGGPDSYWHRRTDNRDPLSMLLEEFIPMIERTVSAPGRALLGWSMGGYGALLAAETAPERFGVVATASPALWTSPGATAPGAFDGPDDYRRNDVFARTPRLAGMTVRVDCGQSDPFYRADRAFVARLPRPSQGSFGPGSHDSAYWRSVAPAQIATVGAALKSRSP